MKRTKESVTEEGRSPRRHRGEPQFGASQTQGIFCGYLSTVNGRQVMVLPMTTTHMQPCGSSSPAMSMHMQPSPMQMQSFPMKMQSFPMKMQSSPMQMQSFPMHMQPCRSSSPAMSMHMQPCGSSSPAMSMHMHPSASSSPTMPVYIQSFPMQMQSSPMQIQSSPMPIHCSSIAAVSASVPEPALEPAHDPAPSMKSDVAPSVPVHDSASSMKADVVPTSKQAAAPSMVADDDSSAADTPPCMLASGISPNLDFLAETAGKLQNPELVCVFSNKKTAKHPVAEGLLLKIEDDVWAVQLTKPMITDTKFYIESGEVVRYHKTFFQRRCMTKDELIIYEKRMKKKRSPGSCVKHLPKKEENDLMTVLEDEMRCPEEKEFVCESKESFLSSCLGKRIWVIFVAKNDTDSELTEMWYGGNVVKMVKDCLTVAFDDGERLVINTKTRKWIPAPTGLKKK